MSPPLVLLTRPAGEADPLAAVLIGRGLRVVAVPTVELRPEPPGGPLDAALAQRWDWIAVTSATGARAVAEAARRVPAQTARWAAVGPATAAALAEAGINADLVARLPSGRGLADDLIAGDANGRLAGRRILLARASAAASDLPSALRAAGADVTDVVAYRTVEAPAAAAGPLGAALRDPGLAAIVVASGAAVRGLVALAGDPAALPGVPLVAIGPSTSSVAEALGFEHVVVATTPSVDALADAVEAAVARSHHVGTRSTP